MLCRCEGDQNDRKGGEGWEKMGPGLQGDAQQLLLGGEVVGSLNFFFSNLYFLI